MEPTRTCIGCRGRDAQSALIRLVRRGDVAVDGTKPRLEGRGAYLHPGCLDLVLKRQALRRALGPGISVAAGVDVACARLASGGAKDVDSRMAPTYVVAGRSSRGRTVASPESELTLMTTR